MQQLVNHNNQQSAVLVESFPIHWNKRGKLRYWVEHNLKKKNDRLFIQLHDGGWALPKQKETADIILLLQEDDSTLDNCGLVFPLLWDTSCKSVQEIMDFAEQYEFNNLQKTVIMQALVGLGCHSAPMWLMGDVIDLAVPVTAVSVLGNKKLETMKAKIWKMVGKGIPPAEQKALEIAHYTKHGTLAERGPINEAGWAKSQEMYDNMFDSDHLRGMGVGQSFIANLETVIAHVKGE